MDNHLSFSAAESAVLRSRLENHLTDLFSGNAMEKYFTTNSSEPERAIANTCTSVTYPEIKLAYSIWQSMLTADRHAVLSKFQCLCTGVSIQARINRKTLIFCSVFINEFAAILAETMEWPD